MTVCMVISLLKLPYIHYIHMYGFSQPYVFELGVLGWQSGAVSPVAM